MKILRFMRIFKLVKLVRVLKASSVFQRWQIYTSIGYSDLLNIVMLDTCMPISLQHISMEYIREAKYHTSMSLFRVLAKHVNYYDSAFKLIKYHDCVFNHINYHDRVFNLIDYCNRSFWHILYSAFNYIYHHV